ncbi:MAG: glycosyltransferase family 1 protein [Candidatus Omnitrophica bacterium]|nr:glycosyltransferase family 1 protein [Candidatus Omnitrophota bacterium]
MKVFFDNVIFNSQRHGGVSKYCSVLISHLKKYKDMEVHALRRRSFLPRRLSRLNMIHIEFVLSSNKYDIYHPTYYSDAVRRRKDIKTVVTVHDMIHEIFSHRYDKLNNGVNIKKRSILNADCLICVSNSCKKDLCRIYDVSGKPVHVVHEGVVSDPPDIFLNQNIAIFERPYILYVGKRWYYKNFKVLLEAYHELKLKNDCDLVCFGGEKFSDEEISAFRNMNLERHIRHVKGGDNLLSLYYKNASVFIYPSLYEGFGLPVLEAMSNGCVVIASNTGSIPEVAGNAALLFSPDNVDELCSCIRQAMNDTRLRKEYVKKGSERIKDFSWDKTALETYNIYKTIVNN